MGNQLITKKFGKHAVEQIIESISEPANNVYYVTTSKHTPYANNTVTTPYDRIKDVQTDYYEQLVFGKKVNSSDVSYMIPRVNWTANTVYDMYSDTDTELFEKQFYVASDQGSTYYIYKVLSNNNGANSTVNPGSTSTSESACNFTTTSDGYVWKLMYKMAEEDFEKFATSDYMPVVQSANVASNTVSGAIDIVTITYPGSNYVATLTGSLTSTDLRDAIPGGNTTTYKLANTASSNNDFYVGSGIVITAGTGSGQLRKIVSYSAASRVATIDRVFDTSPTSGSEYIIAPYVEVTGDGSTNAVGYATVSSGNGVNNYISGVTLRDRGEGYTYASAVITGNTGGVSNSATLNVVIPPPGGHGSHTVDELGSRYLGVSVTFANNESGFISTENDFGQIALIKDPLFKNVHLTLDTELGTFVSGETVYQVDYAVLTGTVTSNSSNTLITGTDTEFTGFIKAGDNVIVFDTINSLQFIRTVSAVTNSTSMVLSSNSGLSIDTGGKIAVSRVLCQGIKSGNSSPYISLSNAEPKFAVNKKIIGASSGAMANVTAINVNEKAYNSWNTFDGRTRISYSTVSGNFDEDDLVYQNSTSLSNAYYHSANSTYIFLTSDRGPINADPSTPLLNEGGSSYTLGSIKYNPDIVKGSGDLLYIENIEPVTRSNSQSETIRLVLKF
jgi:hypothetical protein